MANLFVQILGKDATGGAFTSARGEVNAFEKSIQKTTRTLQIMTAVAAGFAVKAVKEFAKFDNGVREISTLLGDLTDKDLKRLGNEIKKTAITYGQSLDKMTKARYDIISAGFNKAADSAILLEQSARLAVAGVSDVSTTADVLTTILNAYSLSAENAANVNDILFTTVRLGKTTISELAGVFGNVAALAPTLGVKITELAAGFATLTARGISTEETATALNATMTSLLKPSEDLQKRLEQLGYSSSTTAIQQLGLYGALQKITSGATEADLAAYFPNVRAMKAVFPLVGKAAGDLAKNMDAFGDTAGATDKAVKKMSEGIQFRINQLKTAFTVWLVDTGEKIVNLIIKFTQLDTGTKNAIISLGTVAASLKFLGGWITAIITLVFGLYRAWDKNFLGIQNVTGRVVEDISYMFWGIIDIASQTVESVIARFKQFGSVLLAVSTGSWSEISLVWEDGQREINEISDRYNALNESRTWAHLQRVNKMMEDFKTGAKGTWKDLFVGFGLENISIGGGNIEAPTVTGGGGIPPSDAALEGRKRAFQAYIDYYYGANSEFMQNQLESLKSNYEEENEITLEQVEFRLQQTKQVVDAIAGMYDNLYQLRVAQIQSEENEQIKSENKKYKNRRSSLIKTNTIDGKLTAEGQNKLAQLEQEHSDRLNNIREEAREKERSEAKKMKPVKLAQAISNVALGVTEALKSAGPPWNIILAAITAAAGAIEIATIASQPYAIGALRVRKSGTDTVPAMLTPDEAVIPRQVVSGNIPVIQRMLGGQRQQEKTTIINVSPVFNVSAIDSQGVEEFTKSENFRRSFADMINDRLIRIRTNEIEAEAAI